MSTPDPDDVAEPAWWSEADQKPVPLAPPPQPAPPPVQVAPPPPPRPLPPVRRATPAPFDTRWIIWIVLGIVGLGIAIKIFQSVVVPKASHCCTDVGSCPLIERADRGEMCICTNGALGTACD
jgi:hypothetical protein